MVFSGKAFLFYFLPTVLIGYFALHKRRRAANLFLTLASLCFYAWGEPRFVCIMVLSIAVNWVAGRAIEAHRDEGAWAKRILALTVILDLGVLGAYKYLAFFLTTVKGAFSLSFDVPEIALPIGISFFTFQAISYVVDVYRRDAPAQRSFMNACLYIAFFPQLIAGPIVRYNTVAEQIESRRETTYDFARGVRRFLIGLIKKVVLANELARLVDYAFALEAAQRSAACAWLGAVGYLMQVYYDFSGYSDMAIGLGRMFGFRFDENFDYPWLSGSVTGFWRRWHISMTTWFRDYLYFPLGGSRVKSKVRLYLNLLIVWACTGLWHGAAWTYVLWGVAFFAVQALERATGLGRFMEGKGILGILYALTAVVLVTVMIRSASVGEALSYYCAMFGAFGGSSPDAAMLLREYGWCLGAGVLCGLPWRSILRARLPACEPVIEVVSAVGIAALSVAAMSSVALSGYNPFIYFNF